MDPAAAVVLDRPLDGLRDAGAGVAWARQLERRRDRLGVDALDRRGQRAELGVNLAARLVEAVVVLPFSIIVSIVARANKFCELTLLEGFFWSTIY